MIIPQFERIRAVANTPISEVIHVELLRIRYHVVAQYISPTPESWSRRASK
jgi:hypothetical protein